MAILKVTDENSRSWAESESGSVPTCHGFPTLIHQSCPLSQTGSGSATQQYCCNIGYCPLLASCAEVKYDGQCCLNVTMCRNHMKSKHPEALAPVPSSEDSAKFWAIMWSSAPSCEVLDHHVKSWTIMLSPAPSCEVLDHHVKSWTIMWSSAPSCEVLDHHVKPCTILWSSGP